MAASGHPVWDIPTRLFHWLLVAAVLMSWLSHEFEWIDIHLWSGYSVLVLVVFRILWGFWGSAHSRFGDFLHSPRAVWSYWRGEFSAGHGHNPAGGWSVLAMLLLLLLQGLTGLFNSDGLLFDGPLYHALDSGWTDKLGAWHERIFVAVLALVGAHIVAVVYYQWGRGEKLIGPMITGGTGGAPSAPMWRAAILLGLAAGALALAVYLAPAPEIYW